MSERKKEKQLLLKKAGLVSLLIAVILLSPIISKAGIEMDVTVDATELPRKLLKSTIETTLTQDSVSYLYPKWIPGIHGPRGPVQNIGGLEFVGSNDKLIRWQRDWKDVYRFYLYPNENNEQCRISLTYICNQNSVNSKGIDSYGYATLGIINWNTIMLYPEGVNVRDINITAKIILPHGWDYGSALPVSKRDGDTLFVDKISLEEFIDMPLITAEHMKHVEIKKTDMASYYLHIAAHDRLEFDVEDSVMAPLTNLVTEAELAFGRTHFDEYHFLLVLSDQAPTLGLEHRNSSLNGVAAGSLKKMGGESTRIGYLLSHEFVHAWCGKYRRPAGMNTPDYMKDKNTDMLWVYEGLDEYLGDILAARSGLDKTDNVFEAFVYYFGNYQYKKGRAWRPVKDTELSAYVLRGGSKSWSLIRRSQDYYGEGAYVWMEFDARIRNATDGKKSLNDFCAMIFGNGHPDSLTSPLTHEEIVSTLNDLVPFAWDSLITERIKKPQPVLNPETFKQCGFEMDFTNEKSDYLKKREKDRKFVDLYGSIGMMVNFEGKVKEVVPGSLADKAGLYSGAKIIGVNNYKFTKDRLIDAVKNSKDNPDIVLHAFAGDVIIKYQINYQGGLKYPTLKPIKGRKDRLTEILSPLREIEKED